MFVTAFAIVAAGCGGDRPDGSTPVPALADAGAFGSEDTAGPDRAARPGREHAAALEGRDAADEPAAPLLPQTDVVIATSAVTAIGRGYDAGSGALLDSCIPDEARTAPQRQGGLTSYAVTPDGPESLLQDALGCCVGSLGPEIIDVPPSPELTAWATRATSSATTISWLTSERIEYGALVSTLDKPAVAAASACSDRVIVAARLGYRLAFGLRLAFATPAGAVEYRRRFGDSLAVLLEQVSPTQLDELGATIVVQAFQLGGDADALSTLVHASSCTAHDVTACAQTLKQLELHRSRLTLADPRSASDLGSYAVTSWVTFDASTFPPP